MTWGVASLPRASREVRAPLEGEYQEDAAPPPKGEDGGIYPPQP